MKKSLFNQIERQILKEGNSLSASRMKLHIATKRFEKAFTTTSIGRFVQKTVDWLSRLLA